MTASEFAEKTGVPYQTVVRWARESLIPGVQITEFGKFKVYMIPEDALHTFERPKTGRPRKDATSETKQEPAAASKKAKPAKKAAKKAGKGK